MRLNIILCALAACAGSLVACGPRSNSQAPAAAAPVAAPAALTVATDSVQPDDAGSLPLGVYRDLTASERSTIEANIRAVQDIAGQIADDYGPLYSGPLNGAIVEQKDIDDNITRRILDNDTAMALTAMCNAIDFQDLDAEALCNRTLVPSGEVPGRSDREGFSDAELATSVSGSAAAVEVAEEALATVRSRGMVGGLRPAPR